MSRPPSTDLRWVRAATLAERRDALRAERGPPRGDPELARAELVHWRAQSPFQDDELWRRRLAAQGLREEELAHILALEPEDWARFARPPMEWTRGLEERLARAGRGLADLEAIARGRDPTIALLTPFVPLLEDGVAELARRSRALVERSSAAPFAPDASGAFVTELWIGAQSLVTSTLVVEMHLAGLAGELEGANAAERFHDFTRKLARPERGREVLVLHATLTRRVLAFVSRWVEVSAEFLERLALDRVLLERTFHDGRPLGRLERARGGAGDTHRGGRSVVVCTFDSGARLVYKPRSLAAEEHFQNLIAFLNRRGLEPGLRTPRALDRGTYGWVEFAAPAACANAGEVVRFYERQGALLAAAWLVDATDLHFENVIAAGEHPLAVDLETVFHGRAPAIALDDRAQEIVRDVLDRSVLRTGLLPTRTPSADQDFAGADLSGLGARGAQETPDRLLHWEDEGTDAMHATSKRGLIPESNNRPRLGDEPVDALDHVEEIVRGFTRSLELCMRDRASLQAPDGPIARFADDEVRSVLRPTRFYGLILEESRHADFSGDALELERLVDRVWTGVPDLAHLERIAPSERADLLDGDVPCFTSRPGSRSLFDARGNTLGDFWPRTAIDEVRDRLDALDAREIARQAAFIRGAFATASSTAEDPRWPAYVDSRPVDPPSAEDIATRAMRHARAVGERLCDLALTDAGGKNYRTGDRGAVWMGYVFVQNRWELCALGDDLYSGAPGIALFLACLARATGDERFAITARAALAGLVRDRARKLGRFTSIGAFNGLGSLVYALPHLALELDRPELLDLAREAALAARKKIDDDSDLDVIGGAAGLIPALLGLHAVDRAPAWIEIARECGARLERTARRDEDGVHWCTRIGGELPVSGYSHGAAGIAASLAALSRATGEVRWLDLALEAARAENTLFDPASGNWRDPGSQTKAGETRDSGTTMMAWCYGAPGIGLARLELGEREHGLGFDRDAEIAVRTTLREGFGRNHCLCHGAFGNLELLGRAPERGWIEERELRAVRSATLASLERDGVLCGMPLGVESAGLMNGLAGIGLGLLRLAGAQHAPCVLTLDPPRVIGAGGRG